MPKLSAYLSQKRNAQGIASSNIAINTKNISWQLMTMQGKSLISFLIGIKSGWSYMSINWNGDTGI